MKAIDAARLSRQQVRSLGLATRTETKQARQILKDWQDAHPEEPALKDVFEQLYIMEDAWRRLAAEPTPQAA
jgi:hypothetical protein